MVPRRHSGAPSVDAAPRGGRPPRAPPWGCARAGLEAGRQTGVPPQDDDAALVGMTEELRQTREELQTLKAALVSRQMIGVAQGMLMLRYGLDLDRAFGVLRRRSQDENRKLRMVADVVIEELSAEGWPR